MSAAGLVGQCRQLGAAGPVGPGKSVGPARPVSAAGPLLPEARCPGGRRRGRRTP
ncbi:hypothetical protein [Protofrankia symbiont of Coriaria ruscifolia]|uniref:hypothetical protein n=1 Tax=Protofrankia symbiont of Coriaria ruscifolia TaxID=1306542 RepID=UPI0013EF7603|nr:hypothetical protein [Protofrankia symbiont of Coriaria ruscifolia]